MIGTRETCTVDGQTLSYLSDGTSDSVLLFLHGWGGSAESFQPLWEALREVGRTERFISLDFPGFGQSAPPSSSWDVRDYALCVVKYLDTMNINSAQIISHSFGGRVATVLLAEHGGRFGAAVYLAAAGIPNSTTSVSVASRFAPLGKAILSVPLLGTLLSPLRRLFYKAIGSQYMDTSGVMQETFSRVVAEDLRPLFPAITTPATIVWGRNDTYVPISDGEYMAKTIPQAKLHVIEDGRHGIHKTHASYISDIINTAL